MGYVSFREGTLPFCPNGINLSLSRVAGCFEAPAEVGEKFSRKLGGQMAGTERHIL